MSRGGKVLFEAVDRAQGGRRAGCRWGCQDTSTDWWSESVKVVFFSLSTFVLVLVWVCMYTFPCVWASVYMWVCMPVKFQGGGENLFWLLFYLIQWDRISRLKSELINVISLLFWGSPVSTFLTRITGRLPSLSGIYVGSRNLNSGPHACIASSLTTDSSP